MTNIKFFGILILLGLLFAFIFIYNAFSGTTWGGWKPPDRSLELNSKEKIWVAQFEKKNDCTFNYIGLESGFMEDSIIYLYLYCKNKSKIGQKIHSDGEMFTQQLCKSFLSCSINKRPEKYITFSYHNLKIKDKRYPVEYQYLYYVNSDSIIKIK